MGGLIARYAAMYGDADLPADDVSLKPTWAGAADINKIIMLGVPNEGSADAFTTSYRWLLDHRRACAGESRCLTD